MMKTFRIEIHGRIYARVRGASREWAFESWKDSLSSSEKERLRGAAPRGVEEMEKEPWAEVGIEEESA